MDTPSGTVRTAQENTISSNNYNKNKKKENNIL
jgi:hypothetical protein